MKAPVKLLFLYKNLNYLFNNIHLKNKEKTCLFCSKTWLTSNSYTVYISILLMPKLDRYVNFSVRNIQNVCVRKVLLFGSFVYSGNLTVKKKYYISRCKRSTLWKFQKYIASSGVIYKDYFELAPICTEIYIFVDYYNCGVATSQKELFRTI